jgi:hypothetical protein
LDDILEANADTPGFHYQLFDFLLQQPLAIASTGFRWFGDDRTDARMNFQPALLNQVLNHLVCRVGVNLQLRRQSPDRREGLAALVLTAQECLLRGKDHLFEDGLSRA